MSDVAIEPAALAAEAIMSTPSLRAAKVMFECIDEVIEARGVGVELRIILKGDHVLKGHVRLESVDFAVRKAGFGERGDVALGFKFAGAAPILGVAGIPMRPMPAEGGG